VILVVAVTAVMVLVDAIAAKGVATSDMLFGLNYIISMFEGGKLVYRGWAM